MSPSHVFFILTWTRKISESYNCRIWPRVQDSYLVLLFLRYSQGIRKGTFKMADKGPWAAKSNAAGYIATIRQGRAKKFMTGSAGSRCQACYRRPLTVLQQHLLYALAADPWKR